MDMNRGSGNELTNQTQHQDNSTKVCWCNGAANLMDVKWVQDLMRLVRSSVREEFEDVIKREVLPRLCSPQTPAWPPRSSANLADSSATRCLQLHFVNTLPDTLLTLNNIRDEGASLILELRDSLGCPVKVGLESSAKLQIVALDGNFEVEDRDHWSHEEFNKNIVLPRKDKRPLLVGECEIFLNEGTASISNISFTDNSKWMRSGKFRLGAQATKGVPPGIAIRGAVSNAFRVKECRLQSCRKHKTPTLEDEIWRLESIAKNGPICKRLADAHVHTLKDFLQLYHTDAKRLQNILCIPEKKWLGIVKSAELCLLTNEHYGYYDDTTGFGLLLDCVFNIVSVTFEGQNSQPYATLDDFPKEFANTLRENAYENRNELPKMHVPTNQVLVQPQPIRPSSVLCTGQYINATATDQGEQVVQVNTYSPCFQPYTLGYEDNYQLDATLSPMQDSDPDLLVNELLNSKLLQEESGNDFEASSYDNITSKLKAACYVTKAAVLFMVSIQQDSSAPRKRQKLQ